MSDKLNDKQRMFCREFLVDLNATQAAIRAGYSPNSAKEQACDLLTKLNVLSYTQRLYAERAERLNVSADRVLRELSVIAFMDIKDMVAIDEVTGCVRVKGFDEMPKGASRAIKKIKERRVIKSTKDDDVILEATLEIELHDKVKCLELTGKHVGMWSDRGEAPEDSVPLALRIAAAEDKATKALEEGAIH